MPMMLARAARTRKPRTRASSSQLGPVLVHFQLNKHQVIEQKHQFSYTSPDQEHQQGCGGLGFHMMAGWAPGRRPGQDLPPGPQYIDILYNDRVLGLGYTSLEFPKIRGTVAGCRPARAQGLGFRVRVWGLGFRGMPAADGIKVLSLSGLLKHLVLMKS